MEKKNFGVYLKGVYKGCNLFACLIAGVLISALVYTGESLGAFEKFSGLTLVYKLIVLIPLGLGALALLGVAIKGLFEKTIGVTDSVALTGVVLTVLSLVYAITSISTDTFVWKLIAFIIILLLTTLVIVVRVRKCDGTVKVNYDDVPPANATFKTYYKTFFKKYLAFAIAFAVIMVVGLILMDKANFVTTLFTAKNLPLTVTVIVMIAVLFLTLYVARLKDRDIDFVDVLVFVMLFAGLTMVAITFMVGKNSQVLVGSFAGATLVLSILLSVIAIKNTHIETNVEIKEYSNAKSGVKAYFISLKKHVNVIALIAVSLIVASAVAWLLISGSASALINGLKLQNRKEFTIAILVVAVFVLALMFADVSLHRVETIDLIMVVTAVASILALVVDQLIMKQTYIIGGLLFTVVAVISIAFIVIRTRFVKLMPEKAVEEVEVKAEEPTVERATETAVQTESEVVAIEETVATESPELTVVEEEVPVKLKRVNVKKSFEIYLRTGDEQVKENYSAIKNELLSYGIHSRLTKMRENFSKKGLSMSRVKPEKNLRIQAKLLIRGKFLKLYLNVDPSSIDAKYFRIKDVSSKLPDQPTFIKVRSKLSLKRALELITLLAEKEGFKKKKKFAPIDYKLELGDENLSYMQKLGYDYMVKDSVTYQEVLQYKEDWAERAIKTKIVPDAERYIYDEISLKYIEKEYEDGAVIDLESLRQKGLIKINCNHLTVTASETLSKKLYIEANAIDNKTAQMVIIAGGEVTKLIFD